MTTDAKRATDWLKRAIRFDDRLSGSDNINDHEHLIAKLLDGTWDETPIIPPNTGLIDRIKILATEVGDGPCTNVYVIPRVSNVGFFAFADRECDNPEIRTIMSSRGGSEQSALENLETALRKYHQDIINDTENKLRDAKWLKLEIQHKKNLLK